MIELWDKVVGNISEDTFVGWTGAAAWTVNIWERYHGFTELNEDEVDRLIGMLKQAKSEMISSKAKRSE